MSDQPLTLRWVPIRAGYWVGRLPNGRLGAEIRTTEKGTAGVPARWRWTAYRPDGSVVESTEPEPGPMAAKRAAEAARDAAAVTDGPTCSACGRLVEYPSQLDASGRCDECRP